MLTLVVGGAASGKSEFAEELLLQRADPTHRVYIATMEPFGAEGEARIARHRRLRQNKGFQTVECYTGLERLTLPPRSCALLECVGNLCANELYSPAGRGEESGEAILLGVRRLKAVCPQMVVVSNEVHSGGSRYQGDTLRYLNLMGWLNCALAELADEVYEVVCGLPVRHKGEEGACP